MYDTCFLVYTVITLFFSNSESRVYCQDKNALSWMHFGYSCPITCSSIVKAVALIKRMDIKKSMNERVDQKLLNEIQHDREQSDRELRDNGILRQNVKAFLKKDTDTETWGDINETFNINVMEFLRIGKTEMWNTSENVIPHDEDDAINAINVRNSIYDNEYKVNDFPQNTSNIIQNMPFPCWTVQMLNETSLSMMLMRITCTRRSNFDETLLKIMTNILNQYIKTSFKFTEEITEVLLENLFGQNTDLRNNIFDVNKLLKYLRTAISQHSKHTYSQKIVLESQHCFLTSIPGCFCKRGFVESFGQCVKPTDCIRVKRDQRYLKRIILK